MVAEFGPTDSEYISGSLSDIGRTEAEEVRRLVELIQIATNPTDLVELARSPHMSLFSQGHAELFVAVCLRHAPRFDVDPDFYFKLEQALPDTATKVRRELQLHRSSFAGQ